MMQGAKSTAARGPEFQMVNNFRVRFEFGHVMHFAPKILPSSQEEKNCLFVKFLIYYLHNMTLSTSI
jgi:hypothetical protein